MGIILFIVFNQKAKWEREKPLIYYELCVCGVKEWGKGTSFDCPFAFIFHL